MSQTFEPGQLAPPSGGTPRYEQIADAIEAAIDRGEFRSGDRLPTVRALAQKLDVSGASVAVAYGVLARRGRVNAQVGRGTFVSPPPTLASSSAPGSAHEANAAREAPRRASESSRTLLMASWRRRALRHGDRLRTLNPDALVCTASWPDASLLPLDVLKRAFAQVLEKTRPSDLQYTGPEPHPDLVQAALPHLAADGVPAGPDDLVVMSSLRQVLALALRVAPTLVESRELVVAVEEPGHYLSFDTIEGLGHHLVGVDVDEAGVVPSSLASALARGANVVLFTPRAQNPTGASWTSERRAALADVLAGSPRTLIIEDDHLAGIASVRPGSLLGDPRLEDRTIYVRSFSKAIAPDLRMTLVAARSRVRSLLRDGKLVTDGWSSRVLQRALAATLEDPALSMAFEHARNAYAERRRLATDAISAVLPDSVAVATDGMNIWVRLPPGCDALDVMHNAAELGVLVSSGEAFYVQPGRTNAIRFSVGWVEPAEARLAGELLARAALTVDDVPVSIVV